ncbi:MAG: hypothetical protein HPPSJP_4840 [Candidatus Hepatoplasma scabrum]|nr:MAG: hypothetical protein HPPSJP_4840 [Candidatus Hepatoplasma sp.]
MKNKDILNESNKMNQESIHSLNSVEEILRPKSRQDLRITERLFIEGKMNEQIENIAKMHHLISEIIINKIQIDTLFQIYDDHKDKDFSDFYKNQTYDKISKKLTFLKNKVKIFEKELEEIVNEEYEAKLNYYLGLKIKDVIKKLDQRYKDSYQIKHQ